MAGGGPATGSVPTLPYAFRPRWGRRVPLAFAGVFAAGGVLLATAPAGWPAQDRVLTILLGLIGAAFLHRLSDVRIEADERGLRIVNILQRRAVEWPEVVDVHLIQGDPWLVLDLADGTALPAMGVQGSEGAYAREQALQVARLVSRHAGAPQG